MVSCHTADSEPVKWEVNGTVILPPLVFPAFSYEFHAESKWKSSTEIRADFIIVPRFIQYAFIIMFFSIT